MVERVTVRPQYSIPLELRFDAAAAYKVYQRARKLGLGNEIPDPFTVS